MTNEIRYDSKGNILLEGEGERKGGMYYYRYWNDGKRIYIYSKSLTVLRAKEKDELEKMDFSSIPDLSGREMIIKHGAQMTLNDLAEIYFSYKKNLVELTTYNTMCKMYRCYVRDSIGEMKIIDIRNYNIKTFYIQLYSGEKKLSMGTLSRVHSILVPMLDVAFDEDVLSKNPARGAITDLKKSNRTTTSKRFTALTVQEQSEFVNYVRKMNNHENMKNIIFFLLGTGCRIGEALALTWEDVDFEKNVININHSVAYTVKSNGHYGQYIKRPKSDAGIRCIPMLSDVRKALLDEKNYQIRMSIESPEMDGYSDFVFVSPRGRLYTRETIATQIKRIINEHNNEIDNVKLPVFTTNQLRHTFATRLCSNSDDIKSVQYIMGHVDVSTTLRYYADPTYEGIKRSIASLEGVMF